MTTRRNPNQRAAGGTSAATWVRNLALWCAAGYYSRNILLPWGPAVPSPPPRSTDDSSSSSTFAHVDFSNDSLRFRHRNTYKLVVPESLIDLLAGPEHVVVHPLTQQIYVLTEFAQLVELTGLPTAEQEQALLQQDPNKSSKSYEWQVQPVVVKDLGAGRPLGGSFTPDGTTLYVGDAALGLLRIRDYTNPRSTVELVTSFVPILEPAIDDEENAKEPRWVERLTPLLYTNCVTIGPKTGKVYFTDSTDVPPDRVLKNKRYVWDILYPSQVELGRGKPTGRLCEYDPHTGVTRVLATNINMANGIGVDPVNEEWLIINETFGPNVLQLDLTSDLVKSGRLLKPTEYLQPRVVIPSHAAVGYFDNADCAILPGPATTTSTAPVVACFSAVISAIAPIHRFWMRLPALLQVALRTVMIMLPRSMLPPLEPGYTGIAFLDPVTGAHELLQDPTGQDVALFTGVSVATATNQVTKLYLGSLTNKYIGVYRLGPDMIQQWHGKIAKAVPSSTPIEESVKTEL